MTLMQCLVDGDISVKYHYQTRGFQDILGQKRNAAYKD